MAETKNDLVLNVYTYDIELSYINEKTNQVTDILVEQIKSIVIDRNYDKYIMPMVFANLALDRKTIDDLVKNYKVNTMIIRIYKKIEGDIPLKEKIIECKCAYFTGEDINYLYDLAYPEQEENLSKYKLITIGLMPLNVINNNKALTLGTSISGSTDNIIKYYAGKINLVMERLDYNTTYSNQIIQSVNSIAELISYLNSLNVLYKTSYRFFMDFDRSYLLSSANKEIPAKGETINSVLIEVIDILKNMNEEEGMYTNIPQKNYQINVASVDTDLKRSQLYEKRYTSLTGVSTSQGTSSAELKVNKAEYSNNKNNITRVANNNLNMVSNMKGDISSVSNIFIMSKTGLDTSVLNINKRYVIRNYDAHSDLDGDFLLSRKIDVFTRDHKTFDLNTVLTFRIKP